MMPKYMGIHEAHLHLYQRDRLNNILQYTEESDNAALIITRINLAMVTIGREILDMYHLTRNKEHPELFNILEQSYKDIIHKLHGRFIQKKSNTDYNTLNTIKKGKRSSLSSINSDYEKVSITTEDVYIMLKNMDTSDLTRLFIDRDRLRDSILSTHNKNSILSNIIKDCSSTSLQTKLLKK
jgi:hypothetical protein